MIPFAAYESTTPFTLVPTGCFSTNCKNGMSSFAIFCFALGGGAFGIGMGLLAAALAGAASFLTTFPVFTERRLVGPRTGKRSTKTHPTRGTGLPPMRRPSSKSHLYLP